MRRLPPMNRLLRSNVPNTKYLALALTLTAFWGASSVTSIASKQSGTAYAQPSEEGSSSDATAPAADRAASFRAVQGPQAEQVPGGMLLVVAYGLIWVLLLLFVIRLGRKHAATSAELERLSRVLEAASDRRD